MEQSLKLFFDICRLRKGPQDVPASHNLFIIVLLSSLVVDFSIATTMAPVLRAALLVVVHMAVMLFAIYMLARLLGYGARNLQMLTALLGTGLLLSLILLPLLIVGSQSSAEGNPFGLIILVIQLWSLVVTAHILRHTLSIHFMLAGLLAFGYFLLSIQLVEFLLPQGA